ncbi:hypothetical protein ACKGJY_05560 [Hyunsoonleella sp. 2307UL5-6]|uniref:hypothetical protein n=1 Tax=Hyunsoonleella sp. 2307UL5-6 TaxID=3384768 RepID=UPI0039BD07BA
MAKAIIIIFLFIQSIVFSQVQDLMENNLLNAIPKEDIVLYTNDNIFLSGETIYYKTHILNNENKTPSVLSKIGYIELIDKNRKVLFRHKLVLENGVASSDFFIPASIKTGHYKLLGFTKWMLNNSDKPFLQKDIVIINPYIPNKLSKVEILTDNIKEQLTIQPHKIIKPDNVEQDNGITLTTEFNTYKTRTKINIEIKAIKKTNLNANLAISIRKLNSISPSDNFNKLETPINLINNKMYLPELRGEIISGTIVNKNDQSKAAKKTIALSIPSNTYIYKNIVSDTQGKFYFNIKSNYSTPKAILQLIDSDYESYKINLDSLIFPYYQYLNFKEVYLNETIKNWIVTKNISNQIENAYSTLKTDTIKPYNAPKPFYGNPSVSYVLDDYKRFKTLKETFVEVVEGAGIRTENNKSRLIVYRYDEFNVNEYSNNAPLVLFNGIYIKDFSNIIGYDPYNIKKIDLIRGIYFYGSKTFNGIVDISTKENTTDIPLYDEHATVFNLLMPEQKKIYFQPNYSENFEKLKRIPDYRYQLLWKPDIELHSEPIELECFTSDIKGVFEIKLKGNLENGQTVELKKYIEVL